MSDQPSARLPYEEARAILRDLKAAGVAVSPAGFTFPGGATVEALQALAFLGSPERARAVTQASATVNPE